MEHTGDRGRPGGVTSGSPERPPAEHAGAALTFDLADELEQLRLEPSYTSGDRNARTLVKDERLRVVLTAMKAGARLNEHRAPGPVTIQAVEGTLRVLGSGGTIDLPTGQVVSLGANVSHSVEAVNECAFLLTIAWPPGEHAES